MALYEFRPDGVIAPVASTTFAAEHVLERADLQRALRDDIAVLGDDLLVVAEEFGDFEVARRIDLLCVDTLGRLVVTELKRTDDGGHMELQALRYAAMVSAMTFDDLAATYERHLTRIGDPAPSRARDRLAGFLEAAGGQDAILDRRVRIILVSAGFDPQITTTVLWLNDIYGLDIRCVRIRPYRVASKLLLDVQQVIPLPEARELTVRLRRRETAARAATVRVQNRDWSRYVITTPDGASAPLRKRRAVQALVTGLHAHGVPATAIAAALPGQARLLSVAGDLDGEALTQAFADRYPDLDLGRWFLDAPLHADGQTWVLDKMWALDTEPALEALVRLAPGFAYIRDEDEPAP